ncbi:MAG: hypothetical protein HY281_04595 [Nitrospirae bacterium]|nr:hypothetical protein [Nitrospirota bacterium]
MGTGADVMKRLAASMVGGVASAMLLTLIVIMEGQPHGVALQNGEHST